MSVLKNIKKPTKAAQLAARDSYNTLVSSLEEIHTEVTEIEVDETKERIKVPLEALKMLAQILKATGQGRPISIVPVATELTTQAAAELLGCSRPHLVKLLESGAIEFTKVGKHRRVKYEDVVAYREDMKATQKDAIIQMMKSDEELGLYDS
jgi:excisionase family DNA binding protein